MYLQVSCVGCSHRPETKPGLFAWSCKSDQFKLLIHAPMIPWNLSVYNLLLMLIKINEGYRHLYYFIDLNILREQITCFLNPLKQAKDWLYIMYLMIHYHICLFLGRSPPPPSHLSLFEWINIYIEHHEMIFILICNCFELHISFIKHRGLTQGEYW